MKVTGITKKILIPCFCSFSYFLIIAYRWRGDMSKGEGVRVFLEVGVNGVALADCVMIVLPLEATSGVVGVMWGLTGSFKLSREWQGVDCMR